jgi:hypothetical protein
MVYCPGSYRPSPSPRARDTPRPAPPDAYAHTHGRAHAYAGTMVWGPGMTSKLDCKLAAVLEGELRQVTLWSPNTYTHYSSYTNRDSSPPLKYLLL